MLYFSKVIFNQEVLNVLLVFVFNEKSKKEEFEQEPSKYELATFILQAVLEKGGWEGRITLNDGTKLYRTEKCSSPTIALKNAALKLNSEINLSLMVLHEDLNSAATSIDDLVKSKS